MDQLQAVREGDWKLHLPLDNKFDSGDKNKFYGSSKSKTLTSQGEKRRAQGTGHSAIIPPLKSLSRFIGRDRGM